LTKWEGSRTKSTV